MNSNLLASLTKTLAAGLLVLSGCAQIKKVVGSEESVDYKSTVASQPLSIPPDLTQANQDAHYKAPAGTATSSVPSTCHFCFMATPPASPCTVQVSPSFSMTGPQ